jgi:hypothetical protein
VRLDEAFTADQATAATRVVYQATGIDPDDPASWPAPVLRFAGTNHPVVTATITTARLTGALD